MDSQTARFVLYVQKKDDAKLFMASATADVRRQTWVQELSRIQAAPWMRTVTFPVLVDRTIMKAFFRGEELRHASAIKESKKHGFAGQIEDLED